LANPHAATVSDFHCRPGSPNDPNFIAALNAFNEFYPERDEAWRRECAKRMAIGVAARADQPARSTEEQVETLYEVLQSAYGRVMPEAWASKAAVNAVERIRQGVLEAKATKGSITIQQSVS